MTTLGKFTYTSPKSSYYLTSRAGISCPIGNHGEETTWFFNSYFFVVNQSNHPSRIKTNWIIRDLANYFKTSIVKKILCG